MVLKYTVSYGDFVVAGLEGVSGSGLAADVPCPMVSFALGLNDVTVQCCSLLNDGPRDVFAVCRGPEEDFLA